MTETINAQRGLFWRIGAPLRWLLTGLLTGYRNYVSPMLGPRCRYYPSCSAYGLQAVTRHGAAKGSVLAAWRVLRCNPFSGGGVDPVPDRGRWLPDIYPDGRARGSAAETMTMPASDYENAGYDSSAREGT